ncbi:DUF3862 domain-containing protein [Bowmanella sp. JS7-9]|uniref:DUF3862 domain-containing protein n=1 Tax=Pseudobowmanella zhangzhouensis TaxID=1537679 RepID=A0ABW1XJE9_9ALTE|nr:DUF3862 domain-containing protein [Bowmanella sp. JS7-9]TBX26069.1 hypothetical protein TK45_02400 [Bowmanella sp. JS7-9]
MKKYLLSAALIMSLTGCSKLTVENYDKLKMGMTFEQVTDIIGKPDQCEARFGTNSCIWGEREKRFIQVNFIAEKAVLFEKQGLHD